MNPVDEIFRKICQYQKKAYGHISDRGIFEHESQIKYGIKRLLESGELVYSEIEANVKQNNL